MSRLLIVDGHAYAYRAFYAIRGMSSPTGEATNAVYGFVKMLGKMRELLKPTHLIVVWDGGLSAERMAALPGYKAQRPEMPQDLAKQLDEIVGYLGAANIASYCADGVEADDYIACVARRAEQAAMDVVIASADKDFMQLVTLGSGGSGLGSGASAKTQDPRPKTQGWVGLLNPGDKTGTVWGAEQVVAKSGVAPAQIVDWLSLVGDSVDNIPGVPGVGPKTATDLLKQFGSVDAIYAKLDEVKSERIRGALRLAEADVRRNVGLVRLREDLPCEFAPEKLAAREGDNGRLAALFRKWGFRSMLAAAEAAAAKRADLQEALF